MLLFKFSLLILALLTGCSLATDSWSVLSKDIMTVCMGVHMQTNEIGEVAGYKGLEGFKNLLFLLFFSFFTYHKALAS